MTRPLRALIAALGLIGLVAGASACTEQTAGTGSLATAAASAPEQPAPRGGFGEDDRSCPRITDAAAGLAYDCIVASFVEVPLGADPSFADGSLRVGAYTEPTWLAAQQSGKLTLTGESAQYVALLLTAQQTAENYGTGATSQAQLGVDVAGLGESAYRIDVLVTLDAAYAQQHGLAVRSERLCVVVVEVDAGIFSAMTISIPDTRRDLWAAYDAVVASVGAA